MTSSNALARRKQSIIATIFASVTAPANR
jgi:hypothetical protein